MSTGAWSELPLGDNSELRSRSFASKTRETYREKQGYRAMIKRRQADILTKSSLRLPTNRTVVYIQETYEVTSIHGNRQSRTEVNRKE